MITIISVVIPELYYIVWCLCLGFRKKCFVIAFLNSVALMVLFADVSDYCQNFIISDNILMHYIDIQVGCVTVAIYN